MIKETSFFKIFCVILFVTAQTLVIAQTAYSNERRMALVIGNTEYAVGALRSPANDASDMAAVLQRLGFDITLTLNRTLAEMEDDLRRFSGRLRPGDVVFFFYAGHAVQVDGENFLLPVDNDGIRDGNALRRRAISAQEYINTIQSSATLLNIVVLDACRDNPLPQVSRTLTRGLAPASRRPPDTLIVFATGPHDVAEDGTGRNSPFTQAFLTHIATPDQDVFDLYRNVTSDVYRMTEGRQRPEQMGSFSRRFTPAKRVVNLNILIA